MIHKCISIGTKISLRSNWIWWFVDGTIEFWIVFQAWGIDGVMVDDMYHYWSPPQNINEGKHFKSKDATQTLQSKVPLTPFLSMTKTHLHRECSLHVHVTWPPFTYSMPRRRDEVPNLHLFLWPCATNFLFGVDIIYVYY